MIVVSWIKQRFAAWQKRRYEQKMLTKVRSHQGQLHIKRGSGTVLTSNTILGRNPNFNGMQITGHGIVRFGDNFHSGEGCMIITSFHNYEGKRIPYDDTVITKDVTIGDNVWFGNRVIVLGGVTIGEGAILQAGAVVVNDIPPCGIAGGSPAKVFKNRDKEHYEKCKAEGLFW